MIDITYKSTLRRLISKVLTDNWYYQNEDMTETALDMMTDKQANLLFALCKQNNKPDVERLINETSRYIKDGDTHELIPE